MRFFGIDALRPPSVFLWNRFATGRTMEPTNLPISYYHTLLMVQSSKTMPPPDATVRDLWTCQGIRKQKGAFRLDRELYARNK